MIDDINRAASEARKRLDQSIRDDDSPMTDLWSQAIEALECARRLCVKAGARPLKVLRVEPQSDIADPLEENIAYQAKPGDKAAGVDVDSLRQFIRRNAHKPGLYGTNVHTPFGVVEVRLSETVQEGQIEWLG